MERKIKIGDFVKLTGNTLKTVLYYHKIGVLQEPERSQGGYRLYGPVELMRMQLIKHLKSLGLDLKRIKEILGDTQDQKTMRNVLESLRDELLRDKNDIEGRIAKIDDLLGDDKVLMDSDIITSPSFQMITGILGRDQCEKYEQACPELFDQQRKLYGILDDFQWGGEYQESFQGLAEFFKEHPQHYQCSLDFGVRLSKLAQLPEDDPEVDALARESAAFIKSIPVLRKMLSKQSGMVNPLASAYSGMVANVITPSQIKHGQLLQYYLSLGD